MAAPDATVPTSRKHRPVAQPPKSGETRRERPRKASIRVDKQKIAKRVCEFAQQDWEDRTEERARRLQRMAKLRMWEEEVDDFPWPDSSNVCLPDMATDSLRTQDTLHNAVMSNRPIMAANATLKSDEEKKDTIDKLIDHQLFNEQDGEKTVEEAAECFVNEGVLTIFIPWVRERREVVDINIFPRIPLKVDPVNYFKGLIEREFPQSQIRKRDEEGWDWEVFHGKDTFDVSFYTQQGTRKVEMRIEREVTTYDGPKLIVKETDDVLHPARVANLQMPGPSNPNGAPHVILVDYPSYDDIKRLKKRGYYDLLSDKKLAEIKGKGRSKDKEEAKEQKDRFQGKIDQPRERQKSHGQYTLYTCFDRYDIDGDGLDEDVIFWVLEEGQVLLKASKLTELYPMDIPRRPFAEANFLPVKGRREGMSLLELMESTHDLKTELWNQMVDAGTIANSPIGFYRPQSNMKPEVINLFPGDMYPVNDPSRDVSFPSVGNPSQAFHINSIGMVESMQEKLTVIGDLAFGKVPRGKSAALRTTANLQSVLSQAEARPERILRRFFMGWKQAHEIVHELNKRFLPDEKQFRIVGYKPANEDPYVKINSRSDIRGAFAFTFSANVQNASKLAMQGSVEQAMMMLFQPLPIQMGIVQPEDAFHLLWDGLKALGIEPDRYVTAPTPDSMLPEILAEEALTAIINEEAPFGKPAELGGWNEHMQKLLEFQKTEVFANPQVMTEGAKQLFEVYVKKVAAAARQERQLAAQVDAARGSGFGPEGTPGPAGTGAPDLSQPPISGGDEIAGGLPGEAT